MAFTRLARSIPYFKSDIFEELASYFISEYDYIFYISPKGIEIEDNGVRETDAEYRDQVDFEIKRYLRKYNHRIKNYKELEGTTEERIRVVQGLLVPQYL